MLQLQLRSAYLSPHLIWNVSLSFVIHHQHGSLRLHLPRAASTCAPPRLRVVAAPATSSGPAGCRWDQCRLRTVPGPTAAAEDGRAETTTATRRTARAEAKGRSWHGEGRGREGRKGVQVGVWGVKENQAKSKVEEGEREREREKKKYVRKQKGSKCKPRWQESLRRPQWRLPLL